MNEKTILILLHGSLFLLQIVSASLAIALDPKFAGLAPVIGGAQAFFPNPFK